MIRNAGWMMVLVCGVPCAPLATVAQPAAAPTTKTILAIGAHAGDMELTPVRSSAQLGAGRDLLMTLGEVGNTRLYPQLWSAETADALPRFRYWRRTNSSVSRGKSRMMSRHGGM